VKAQKLMEYTFNEGQMDLPLDGRIDRTMNVLALPDGSGVTYIISRDELRTGESLLQLIQRQLGDLAAQVKGYQPVMPPTELKPPSGVSAAFEFGGAFTQNEQGIHQRQVAMQLSGTQRVIIFTMSGFESFDKSALNGWQAAISSFKPRAAR